MTVIWEPSPDEMCDDHLHYSVSKRDSIKGSWSTVARQALQHVHHFRVYAKKDTGMSAPSESSTWGSKRKNAITRQVKRSIAKSYNQLIWIDWQ
ncbi:immunoglobulin-like and fibronectin type III domain-containing protein 1 [Oncorhynchus keta]|uniref:immunoglobulin-like and fibronectin type III domain-containing protein 1 n=1 Tax=Oncorhynchus keta TaxID=8018 RepID=UPI00227D0922|nr:immunoglobulin-like and fibronectin type III domain-containing protein 1 [Oncorhynchus keta]